jgi:hypothetical protein
MPSRCLMPLVNIWRIPLLLQNVPCDAAPSLVKEHRLSPLSNNPNPPQSESHWSPQVDVNMSEEEVVLHDVTLRADVIDSLLPA